MLFPKAPASFEIIFAALYELKKGVLDFKNLISN